MPHPHVPGMRTTPGISQLSKEQVSRLAVMQHNREMFMKAALKLVDSRYCVACLKLRVSFGGSMGAFAPPSSVNAPLTG